MTEQEHIDYLVDSYSEVELLELLEDNPLEDGGLSEKLHNRVLVALTLK